MLRDHDADDDAGIWKRLPRHAKAYRNFSEENKRLQKERIDVFGEYVADVKEGRFPEKGNLVEMDATVLEAVVKFLK